MRLGDFMKKERIKIAAFFVLTTVACNAILALLLACISTGGRSFVDAFQYIFFMCFGLFGGSSVITAFLLLATKLPEKLTYNFGFGFYYGTLACATALVEFFRMEDFELAVIISAVIAGLCCYIFWLKNKDQP